LSQVLDQPRKPIVLLIEDDNIIREIVGTILNDMCALTSVGTASEGLQCATETTPDLILLDVGLPDISGFDVCRKLKEDPNLTKTPIVFLTSLSSLNDEVEGLNAGGIDYITKPVKPKTLRARVRNHLERKLAQDALEKAFAETILAETAKARAESHMLEMRGRETLGRLTAGLAHEFNSLFGSLILNAELLADDLPRGSESAEYVDMMLEALRRGAKLTQSLVSYAGKQTLQTHAIDLQHYLHECADVLRAGRSDILELTVSVAAETRPTRVDKEQLLASLSELVTNAVEANKDGRAIVQMNAKSVELEKMVMESGVFSGAFIRIDVADKGHGMDPAVLRRACEPFFTTKEVGEGPGLGLSTVEGFARQSGGFVSLESAPMNGTTVSLFLPASADPS